jgi:hypothetical protein
MSLDLKRDPSSEASSTASLSSFPELVLFHGVSPHVANVCVGLGDESEAIGASKQSTESTLLSLYFKWLRSNLPEAQKQRNQESTEKLEFGFRYRFATGI